jgi:hypothetical protein
LAGAAAGQDELKSLIAKTEMPELRRRSCLSPKQKQSRVGGIDRHLQVLWETALDDKKERLLKRTITWHELESGIHIQNYATARAQVARRIERETVAGERVLTTLSERLPDKRDYYLVLAEGESLSVVLRKRRREVEAYVLRDMSPEFLGEYIE